MKINKPTPFRYTPSPLKSAAFDKLMTQFSEIDTSAIKPQGVADVAPSRARNQRFDNFYRDMQNPYSDMTTENLQEDLTVDQRAFDLQRETTQQSQANMLDAMRASGGFNAGNIQALANQGTQAARQMSADIGRQEQTNQAARLQGAEDVQRRRELIAKGQSDVDMQKAAGATAAQSARAQAGQSAADRAMQASMANQQARLSQSQMGYQAAQDARNFQASHIQGMMALQAGRDEAALANQQASRGFFDRMFG